MDFDQDIEKQKESSEEEQEARHSIDNSSHTAQKKKKDMLELYEWVESCVLAVACILLIFTFAVRTATVSGPSMMPTLQDKDRLILQQIGYHDPQYGDVVVIDRTHTGEPPIIKRVIGKAGDIMFVDFETGAVWRNDKLLDEPYINEPTLTVQELDYPIEVPEGTIFVMGDNRNHSLDSRSQEIGMVDLRRVMGKAVFRFLPLSEIGAVQSYDAGADKQQQQPK